MQIEARIDRKDAAAQLSDEVGPDVEAPPFEVLAVVAHLEALFPFDELPQVRAGRFRLFARAIGEYGSVIFISGNLPMKTEILPLLIVSQLEQVKYEAAAVIASGMLLVSFFLLFLINLLQRRLNWQTR